MKIPLDEALGKVVSCITDVDTLVRAVLSGSRRNYAPEYSRVDIKPVLIKGQIQIQLTTNDGRQSTTKNIGPNRADIRALVESGYANFVVESTTEVVTVQITKKDEAIFSVNKVNLQQDLSHDKKKSRLLNPADPFLIEVGISDSDGRVKPSRQDKFLQVEEFLRILAPTLDGALQAGHIESPTHADPLEIVDLGCGHAYLTFGAHQYLRAAGKSVHVIGIDIREESRARNEQVARSLGISASIEFHAQEIAAVNPRPVDIAIALHACDTATDDALAWSVRNGAKIILAAPCCHHQLQSQMDEIPEPWSAITRHGILKERLGDILTDALRAQILRFLGYRVDAIEFIGGEHTPRNLMIRAVKTGAKPDADEIRRYIELLSQWKIEPHLADLLRNELTPLLS